MQASPLGGHQARGRYTSGVREGVLVEDHLIEGLRLLSGSPLFPLEEPSRPRSAARRVRNCPFVEGEGAGGSSPELVHRPCVARIPRGPSLPSLLRQIEQGGENRVRRVNSAHRLELLVHSGRGQAFSVSSLRPLSAVTMSPIWAGEKNRPCPRSPSGSPFR